LGGDVLRDIFKATEVATCIDMHIHYSELHRFDTGLGERVLAYTLMGLLEIWWLNCVMEVTPRTLSHRRVTSSGNYRT